MWNEFYAPNLELPNSFCSIDTDIIKIIKNKACPCQYGSNDTSGFPNGLNTAQ